MTFRLLVLLALAATSCSGHEVCTPPTTEVCPAAVPSFAAEVLPILNQRCNNCHAANVDGGPWPLDTRQNVKDWRSLIIEDLRKCSMPPPGSDPMPTAERDKLWAWLICGAPDN